MGHQKRTSAHCASLRGARALLHIDYKNRPHTMCSWSVFAHLLRLSPPASTFSRQGFIAGERSRCRVATTTSLRTYRYLEVHLHRHRAHVADVHGLSQHSSEPHGISFTLIQPTPPVSPNLLPQFPKSQTKVAQSNLSGNKKQKVRVLCVCAAVYTLIALVLYAGEERQSMSLACGPTLCLRTLCSALHLPLSMTTALRSAYVSLYAHAS